MTPQQFLQDLVHYRTYAATKADGTKESVAETIARNEAFHIDRFPLMADRIREIYKPVYAGVVVPSMRTMQFAGEAISRSNARAFNCSFLHMDSVEAFAELFWLLMNGVGVGYSVQWRHVRKIGKIPSGLRGHTHFVADSKEGWADAVKALFRNPKIELNYSQVRPAGSPISTGGTASGPESLRAALEHVRKFLIDSEDRILSGFDVHCICCILADVVVVGGVRRAAMISLFDAWDSAMLTCKQGQWWTTRPYLARSNNSAILLRSDPHIEELIAFIVDAAVASNSGEPGFILTNSYDMGTNPCAEAALRPFQFCNLTEIFANKATQPHRAAESAAALGTLQASLTDFTYLRPIWKQTTDEDALLGISLTGLASASIPAPRYRSMVETILRTNSDWSAQIGVNSAARTTMIKPSGSTSVWGGSTSGIHADHAEYYIRRVRIEADNPIAKALVGSGIIEQDLFGSNLVISVPIHNTGAITKDAEGALGLLNRVKHMYDCWVRPGHRRGDNTHSISVTVTYKPDEVADIKRWLIDNRTSYSCISLLPLDDSSYQQMPFETITKDRYDTLVAEFPSIDLKNVSFKATMDDRLAEVACAGGVCEWAVK